jgi:hypothetical protein
MASSTNFGAMQPTASLSFEIDHTYDLISSTIKIVGKFLRLKCFNHERKRNRDLQLLTLRYGCGNSDNV